MKIDWQRLMLPREVVTPAERRRRAPRYFTKVRVAGLIYVCGLLLAVGVAAAIGWLR